MATQGQLLQSQINAMQFLISLPHSNFQSVALVQAGLLRSTAQAASAAPEIRLEVMALSITMEDGLAPAAAGQLDVSGYVKQEAKSETAAVVPAKAIRRQVPTTAEACVAAVADGIVTTAGWLKADNVSSDDEEQEIRECTI